MASQSSSQEIQLTFKYVDGKFIPVVQKDLPIEESAMSSGLEIHNQDENEAD